MLKFLISSLFVFSISVFAQTIDLDATIQKSYKTDKIPLIFLHRVGCSYCNSMEEFTFDDDDVKNFINKHFHFVSINVTTDHDILFEKQHMEGLDFAKEVGYNFYPSVLFLDKDGEILYASVGYKEEKEFLLILEYIQTRSYKTLSFDQYKHKKMDR